MSTSTEPAIKSYFFGKGYRDLIAVIKESWERNLDSTKNFFAKTKTYGQWWEVLLTFIFWGGAGVSVVVFGTLFFVAVSLLHITLLGLFFMLIYIGFTIVWGVERTHLFIQGFFSACPHCYEKTTLPEYVCKNCGAIHKKLMPNSYGILSHQCQCGQKLPATFFLNRGELQARCQACHQLLHREHVESRRIFIPILGGPSSGKTAFMFAVVRKLVEEKAAEMGFETDFIENNTKLEYRKVINQLRKGKVPAKTLDAIPKAFNLALKKDGKTKWLMYIYDPAGETYQDTENLSVHLYYKYLSGMIMIVDPFSIPAVRRDYENDLSRTWSSVNPSQLNLEDALAGVLLTLEESFGLSKTSKIKKPLAVVISKADAFGLEKRIGEEAVDKAVGTGSNRIQIKSDLIKQQLIDWDEGALIQQIETRFNSVRYFSCSALGRIPDSTSNDFVPHHVFEPMSWIFDLAFKKNRLITIFENFDRQSIYFMVGAIVIIIILFIGIFSFTGDNSQQPVSPNTSKMQPLPNVSQTTIPAKSSPDTTTTQISSSSNAPKTQEESRTTLAKQNSNVDITPPHKKEKTITPVEFIRTYYEEINRGNTESAISKWLFPNEEKLRILIEDSEWVRINEVYLINQDAINAKLSLDVSGQSKNYSIEQRWKGTVELENVESEWKISRMRLRRNQAVIYQENETYHLGDEKIRSWKALHGECFTAKFYVDHPIQKLTLKLDIWGSESYSSAIFLNGMKVATLPYQEQRTRKWIPGQVILPTNEVRPERHNQVQICSGVTKEGDKDDLQIRKIKLIAE
jgi:hypothetical protein